MFLAIEMNSSATIHLVVSGIFIIPQHLVLDYLNLLKSGAKESLKTIGEEKIKSLQS